MIRDDWKQFETIANKPEVKQVMRARCEEQGHEYEYGVSIMFQISQCCKWCGERK